MGEGSCKHQALLAAAGPLAAHNAARALQRMRAFCYASSRPDGPLPGGPLAGLLPQLGSICSPFCVILLRAPCAANPAPRRGTLTATGCFRLGKFKPAGLRRAEAQSLATGSTCSPLPSHPSHQHQPDASADRPRHGRGGDGGGLILLRQRRAGRLQPRGAHNGLLPGRHWLFRQPGVGASWGTRV